MSPSLHPPTPLTSRRARSSPHATAFTLIELLVVISIIAMLISILLPSLASARTSAMQVREMSAARQMGIAQAMYADAHDGFWIEAIARDVSRPVVDPGGTSIPATPAYTHFTGRYPFRLAEYVGHNYRGVMYVNEGETQLVPVDLGAGPEYYYYLASLHPSFGLNGEFVGGVYRNGQNAADDWPDQLVQRPGVDAKAPSGLIAFTSARYYSALGTTDETPGYIAVFAPRNMNTTGGTSTFTDWLDAPFDRFGYSYLNTGAVDPRYNGAAVTGFCDGHAEAMFYDDLRDMTLWSNEARLAGDADFDPKNP